MNKVQVFDQPPNSKYFPSITQLKTMSQIEVNQIIEQIKQEIEVDASGKGKASIRATARLANVNDAGLLRSLKTAALEKWF